MDVAVGDNFNKGIAINSSQKLPKYVDKNSVWDLCPLTTMTLVDIRLCPGFELTVIQGFM